MGFGPLQGYAISQKRGTRGGSAVTAEERSIIAYRMERAWEAIDEAKMLFDAGHTNS